MKKICFYLPLLFILMSVALFACEIRFDSSSVKANSQGKATVTVYVKLEHRNCSLEDDDVSIDYNGVKLIKSSGWTDGGKGVMKNTLEVKLTAKEGLIKVWRECSKKGVSEASVKITK